MKRILALILCLIFLCSRPASATTWYVSTGSGSNSNGGTSLTVLATASDGVTDATNTLTSASANFTNALVNHGIKIGTSYRLVSSVTDGTHLVYSGASKGAASGVTYTVGGMWGTIGQSMASTTPITGGDTVYIAPGTYRETITASVTPSSVITYIGDVDGYYTGGTGGTVRLTAYTTNDTTAPSASVLLGFTGSGAKNLTIENIVFQSGGGSVVVNGDATACVGMTFQDCTFIYYTGLGATVTTAFNTASNWTFDRCRFYGLSGSANYAVRVTATRGTGSDYDTGVKLRSCFIHGPSGALKLQSTGAGANFGGGCKVLGCSLDGGTPVVSTADANLSTSVPILVYGCYINGTTGVSANTSGQITEDYNIIDATTARTNVTAGTHSVSDRSYAEVFEVGQDFIIDRRYRPVLTPATGSPFFGICPLSVDSDFPTFDLLNRPRPAGGASSNASVGCLERHDMGTQDSSQSPPPGYFDLKQLGPMDDEFLIPVQKNRLTLIRVQFKTSSYSGTNYPQLQLLQDGESGVAAQTITAGSAATSFTSLSTSSFTPIAGGWVRIRLVNRTGDGAGTVYWRQPSFTALDTSTLSYSHRGELPRPVGRIRRQRIIN